VPLTKPCTRKLIAKGEDLVGMDTWAASRPSRPEPEGGWPSDHSNAVGNVTSPEWPSDGEEKDSSDEDAGGIYDTARPLYNAPPPTVQPHQQGLPRLDVGSGARGVVSGASGVGRGLSAGANAGNGRARGGGGVGGGGMPYPVTHEPVYDAQPDLALQRLHIGAITNADATEEPMYASEPVLAGLAAISPTRPLPMATSTSASPARYTDQTDDIIDRQREASRSSFGGSAVSSGASGGGVRRGFAPPPFPPTAAPSEPSYAEVDPESPPTMPTSVSGHLAPQRPSPYNPTKYVLQAPGNTGTQQQWDPDADNWVPEENVEPIDFVPEDTPAPIASTAGPGPRDDEERARDEESPSSASPSSSPEGAGAWVDGRWVAGKDAGAGKDGEATNGGVRRPSMIKRMFSISRKSKTPKSKQADALPRVSIGAVEDEASSVTRCTCVLHYHRCRF
jgi:hypothetical protein